MGCILVLDVTVESRVKQTTRRDGGGGVDLRDPHPRSPTMWRAPLAPGGATTSDLVAAATVAKAPAFPSVTGSRTWSPSTTAWSATWSEPYRSVSTPTRMAPASGDSHACSVQ